MCRNLLWVFLRGWSGEVEVGQYKRIHKYIFVYIQNKLVVKMLNYAVHKIALSSPSPTVNWALLYFTLLKAYKI